MKRKPILEKQELDFMAWLIKKLKFSDGIVASIMQLERSTVRYLRIKLGIDANSRPGKRIRKK